MPESIVTRIRSGWTVSPLSDTRSMRLSEAGLRRFFTEKRTPASEFRKLERLYRFLSSAPGMNGMGLLLWPGGLTWA